MKRYMDTVWLKGACILSAMLIGTSMGGAGQTVSAANSPDDESSGQTTDLTDPIEAPLAEVVPLAAASLSSRPVFHARVGNYLFAKPSILLVPLTGAPDPIQFASDPFTTSGRFFVTYEAECAVGAVGFATYVSIDIELVNHATGAITVLPPSTGAGDALCTSNGTPVTDGWARQSMTAFAGVPTPVPSAEYHVQIRAKIPNGVAGNTGHLGDTSLVIHK